MTTVFIQPHKGGFLDKECLICMSNEPDNRVGSATQSALVHLSCHPEQPYHRSCMRRWVQHNPTCPLDRKKINIQEDTQTTGCSILDYALRNIPLSNDLLSLIAVADEKVIEGLWRIPLKPKYAVMFGRDDCFQR